MHDGLISRDGFTPDAPWSFRAAAGGQARTAVLAVGSNASPEVLAGKLLALLADPPDAEVAVEVCGVTGLAVGHSAHISQPGYVAATPYLTPHFTSEDPTCTPTTAYSLGWFTTEQLVALDATEPNYDRVTLPPTVCVTPRAGNVALPGVMVYRSRHGVLGEEGRPLAMRSQDQIHRWLAQRLPHLSGRSSTTLYADPQVRDEARVELIRRGLVVPSGLT